MALVFLVGLFDFRRPGRIAHLDLLVLLSFGISQAVLQRRRDRRLGPARLPAARLSARTGALDRLPRRRGAAPVAAGALAGARRDPPDRLPDHDQHRRLGGDRRRLRGHDRRRPDHPRRAALGRGRVPRRQPLRRHLRAGQLLRLRPVRARAALERRVGRAGPPRTPPRSPSTWRRSPASSSARRACVGGRAGRDLGVLLRVRLGRLPVHGVRAAVELQRLAGRGAGRLVAGAVRPPARPRGAARRWRRWPSSRRWRWCRCTRPASAACSGATARAAGWRRCARWPCSRSASSSRRRCCWSIRRSIRASRRSSTAPWSASSTAPRRSASGARSTGSSGCRRRSSRRPPCSPTLLAFVPRRRDLPQVAALAAAVLIALQLSVDHWFYLYIPWFFGALVIALLCLPASERVSGAG